MGDIGARVEGESLYWGLLGRSGASWGRLRASWDGLSLPFPSAGLGPNRIFAVLPPLSHHKTHLNFTQLNTPHLNSSQLTF